jgi:chloramphenicol 3-O-phosphotransferase
MQEVTYTNEPMELGADVTDQFPAPEKMAQWPVYVYDGDNDEGEALIEFRLGAKVDAITMDAQQGITLHFENGQCICAPLAKKIHLDNKLKTDD